MSDLEKVITYFTESSEEDWKIAQKLFRSKDYGYSLFFCHLTLEKLIKAILVKKTNEPAPYSHDLSLLAKQAGISLTSDLVAEFNTVSTFNIAGRYDDEKRKFHKRATKDYAEKYLNITKNLISWLKKDYLKK